MKISECQEALRVVEDLKKLRKTRADLADLPSKIIPGVYLMLEVCKGNHRAMVSQTAFLKAIEAALKSTDEDIKACRDTLTNSGFVDDTPIEIKGKTA